MIRYYFGIAFVYDYTINCIVENNTICDNSIDLNVQTLGSIPQVEIYSLVFDVKNKRLGRIITDLAIQAATGNFLERSIIDRICGKEGFSSNFDDFNIKGIHCYNMDVLVTDTVLDGYHAYDVSVHDGEISCFDLKNVDICQASSTFELWKNSECDRSVMYQPQGRPFTIIDFCECLIYELVTLWKKLCLPESGKGTASASETVMADTDVSVKIEPAASRHIRVDAPHEKPASHLDLEALRRNLPRVPSGNKGMDGWLAPSEFSTLVGMATGTLRNNRSEKKGGRKTQDGLFGQSKDGYVWGKGKVGGQCFYLRPDKQKSSLSRH